MTTKAARYVQFRLDGCGSREAARRAGFAAGVPGSHALELLEAVNIVSEWQEKEEKLDDKLDRHEAQVRKLRRLKRASKVLTDLDNSPQQEM